MTHKQKGLTISVGKGERKHIVQQPPQHPGPVIKVGGRVVSAPHGRGVDLVFVVDTTGSMSDKIDGLLATCHGFVDVLGSLQLSQRIAVVAFGDLTIPGDDIAVFGFTDNVERVKATLRGIPRYSGGGNLGESSLEALGRALALPFRPGAVKVIILLTD